MVPIQWPGILNLDWFIDFFADFYFGLWSQFAKRVIISTYHFVLLRPCWHKVSISVNNDENIIFLILILLHLMLMLHVLFREDKKITQSLDVLHTYHISPWYWRYWIMLNQSSRLYRYITPQKVPSPVLSGSGSGSGSVSWSRSGSQSEAGSLSNPAQILIQIRLLI